MNEEKWDMSKHEKLKFFLLDLDNSYTVIREILFNYHLSLWHKDVIVREEFSVRSNYRVISYLHSIDFLWTLSTRFYALQNFEPHTHWSRF